MNPVNHVAIIMDGNGRWGLKKKNSRNLGHKAGLNVIEKIISESLKKQISFLTLYAFSTENWKRPKKEINYLFNLLENFLTKKTYKLKQNGICLNIIGNKSPFNKKLKKTLLEAENMTKKNTKLQINLALNYGSKSELIQSIKQINRKKLPITEKNIKNYLYSKNTPDPDLLIRTGNTNRLSNFLLWQLAYSEIYFVKKLWPDFNIKDFNKILIDFKELKRNFGAV